MKIYELLPNFDDEIRTLHADNDLSLVEGEVKLFPSLENKELIIKQGDRYEVCSITDKDTWVYSIENCLWYIKKINGNQITLISLKTLPVDEIFGDKISVGVDEKIRDEVAKKANFVNPSIENIAKWLSEEFILESDSESRILVARYWNESLDKDQPISIIGRNFLLVVEATERSGFWIKRLVPLARNQGFSISVINQSLEFCDATVAASLATREEIEKLQSLRRDQSSYIALWEEYNRLEDKKAEDEARAAGYLRYNRFETELTVDGSVEWRFYFDAENETRAKKLIESLLEMDSSQVEISKDLPEWLIADASEKLSIKNDAGDKVKGKLRFKKGSYLVIELARGAKPTEKGVIYFSLAGQQAMSSRRRDARDKINNRVNGMPQLCHIIEGQQVRIPRYKTIDPKKAGAQKHFKKPPTPKQLEALDVALNTPDIALILGPPGTGKTQIISALQRILAKDEGNSTSKEFLVSSFQNDAVDNVVDRSDVFGLPAIRVGKKGKSDAIQRWITKQETGILKVIVDERSGSSLYRLISEIRLVIAALLVGKLGRQQYTEKVRQLTNLLDAIKLEYAISLSPTLMLNLEAAISGLLENHNKKEKKSEKTIIRKIRALRTTKVAFEDDGVERLMDCLFAVSKLKVLSADELSFLEMLSERLAMPDAEDIKKLKELKSRLLQKLLPDPKPLILQQVVGGELNLLLKLISNELTEVLTNTSAGIDDVLSEYLSTLKYQRERVQRSLENYTTTLGATCQGSVTDDMLKVLSAAGQEGISFDTVIIDEAARANPLDLFIPMSLARRRIVLVGDHYQLPQMLEPDIEVNMQESGVLKDSFKDALRESLFERLYKQLKDREKMDGFTRTVMLDTQFRMHPIIGEFVSQYFYENEGEEPIKPGLDKEAFKLDLGKINAGVVNWMDVPNALGKEMHVGKKSWLREIEVEKVSSLVCTLLGSYPESSIGVITFHAPQREKLFEVLQQKGICKKGEEGWEYEEDYVSTPEGEERIRVGTVDAFQGKEFDIVILSMTRSNDIQGNTEEDWNRKFGFLRLPNRLNVAFSRARNALFVVGDKTMFLGMEAQSAIPSVHAFANKVARDYA